MNRQDVDRQDSNRPRGHRRISILVSLLAAVAALGAACVPDPGGSPTTSTPTTAPDPGLPTAPRVRVPASLPEGTKLVLFHYGPDSVGDVYLADEHSAELLDGSDPTRLIDMSGRLADDGRALVTQNERPDLELGHDVALCPTVTSNDCERISGLRPSMSSFSPDGTKIALAHSVPGDPATWTTIIDADTLDVINGVRHGGDFGSLRMPWSPDSSEVAISLRDDPQDAFSPTSLAALSALDDEAPRVVLEGTDTLRALMVFGWSDDGWISYMEIRAGIGEMPQTEVRSIPADGSAASQLLRQHYILSGHVPLPDGSMIGNMGSLSPDQPVPHLLRRGGDPAPLALPQQWVDEFGDRLSSTDVIGYVRGD